MHLHRAACATVFQNREPIAEFKSISGRSFNDETGRHASQEQLFIIRGAKNEAEFRVGEGADATLCHDNLIGQGRN